MAYIPPAGDAANFVFKGSYGPPTGDAVNFVFGGDVGQSLVPAGIAPIGFGTSTITNVAQGAFAQGIAPGVVGTLTIFNRTNPINPAGIASAMAFGSATIFINQRFITPSGIAAGAFGVPSADLTLRYITVNGIAPGVAGSPTIWFKNRTLAPNGLNAGTFGVPTVVKALQFVNQAGFSIYPPPFGTLTIQRNEKILAPVGISSGAVPEPGTILKKRFLGPYGIDSAEYGLAFFYNLRQVVTQTPPDAADPAKYGQPSIANRNRVVGTFGTVDSRFGSGLSVLNNARIVAPSGFSETWGDALVALKIRVLQQHGFDELLVSNNTILYNTTQLLYPSGISRGVAGVPRVWDNTQRIDTADGGVDTSLWGTPFVAYRVRALDADRFGAPSPYFPEPYIGLYSRTVAPAGLSQASPDPTGFGAATFEIHFNILGVHGADSLVLGQPSVVNKTPQLFVGSQEAPVNYQKPYVGFRVRPAQMEGFDASLYGKPYIGPRTREIKPGGWESFRITGNNWVHDDAPQIPGARTILARGDELLRMGATIAELRGMYVKGFDAVKWGVPTVTTNVIFAQSVPLAEDGQIGLPSFSGPQYVYQFTPFVGDPPSAPAIGPYYLRISEDFYGELVKPIALMDYPDIIRPLFGTPTVSNKNRSIQAFGTDMSDTGDNALVAYRVRRVYPVGMKLMKFGFPFIPNGGAIYPFWGRDIAEDLPGVSYDTAQYGEATVSFPPPPYDPNVRPVGSDMTLWGNAQVENFIRVVRASGAAPLNPAFGTAWIHPPIHLYPSGFAEKWGTAYIDFKNRVLSPVGIGDDESSWGYESGSYNFGVLKVRHRFVVTPTGAVTPIIPSPEIELADLGCIATLGDTSAFGRPRVGACAC